MRDGPMRTVLLAAAAALVLAGGLFAAQGLDLPFAPRSTMTADPTWVAIGAALLVGGLALAGWLALRRPG
jgi:hypothetical protein